MGRKVNAYARVAAFRREEWREGGKTPVRRKKAGVLKGMSENERRGRGGGENHKLGTVPIGRAFDRADAALPSCRSKARRCAHSLERSWFDRVGWIAWFLARRPKVVLLGAASDPRLVFVLVILVIFVIVAVVLAVVVLAIIIDSEDLPLFGVGGLFSFL